MKVLILFILFFSNNVTFAQIHIINYSDPEPLDLLFPSLEPQEIKNIKHIIYFTPKEDTIAFKKFNREGNLINYYSYSDGVRNNFISNYKYSKKKDTIEISSYKGEKLDFYSKSYYDGNKNCIRIDYLDSFNMFQTKFRDFDKNNNCIREYIGKPITDTLYFFEDKKPLKIILPNQKAFFKYNEDMLLRERVDSIYNTLNFYLKYEYEQDRIIKKELKNETRHYKYENNKLSFIKFLYKNDEYIDALLFYNDFGKLDKVLLHGNTFKLPLYFTFSYDYSPFYFIKNGKELKMEFIYDKYNNVTEKKFYVDNQYKYSLRFKIEYYH